MRMRHASVARRLLAAVALALLAVAFAAPPARADDTPDSWKIDRYQVQVDTQRDGTMAVTVDFDFDFAGDEAHGPLVALPLRQRIDGDPDHWRTFTIDQVQASSPSAPADLDIGKDGGVLEIRIGDADREITGKHSYRLNYRVRGIVNPDVAASGLDEVSWNVIGPQWLVPLNNISVAVTGPVDSTLARCFTGADTRQPCSGEARSGAMATFAQDHLDPEVAMQVVAGFPVGTFVGAEPTLTKRYHPGNLLPLTAASGSLTGATLAGGMLALGLLVRRGRDRQFAAATHGFSPGAGGDTATRAAQKTPVAVQFTPPTGAAPGELGTLTDERAEPRDVTATLVDLAVRGYLRIEEITDPATDHGAGDSDDKSGSEQWRLVKLRPGSDLARFEKPLFDGLFASGDTVELQTLAEGGSFAETMTATVAALNTQVTEERRWFRRSPQKARAVWAVVCVGLVLGGAGLAVGLAFAFGLGLVGVAVAVVGLIGLAFTGRAVSRTAEGTAMLQQALGFRQYLTTAEADQIRVEEAQDVFSRYLPYAIAWDCADRWADIFAELARRGVPLTAPVWYVGAHPYAFAGGSSFAQSIGGFSSAATTSMTASTTSSSGGSGFSGGGGVGGGGGGGW